MKRDMIAIKHEIDSVQLVKDEIDEIRESLDRLEVESQRRKNKLLEQVQSRLGYLITYLFIIILSTYFAGLHIQESYKILFKIYGLSGAANFPCKIIFHRLKD